jgi:hypothetical protein
MSSVEYSPLLRNGSSRSGTTQHHLPIHSHYFDITDIESWPIAGLLVLLDGQGQPVRAELHLYDELAAHVQEAAIRQARLVLQERYLGGAPVPVRILETFQVREEMTVRLPPVGARPMTMANLRRDWRVVSLVAGGLLVLALLFWVGNALIGPMSEDDPEVVAESTSVALTPAGEQEAQTQTVSAPAAQDNVAAPASAPGGAELPLSRNARGDLGIGMRVQVVPGLRVALRSEPGMDRGVIIGEITDGDIVTIVAGPEYTQGDADTIVWWLIELDNGTQSWAAANTSQQTLLIPAQ